MGTGGKFKLVSDNYKNILRSQTNAAAIPAEVTVRYGVTVRRANLRNLPTGEGLFFYASDRNFDALLIAFTGQASSQGTGIYTIA